MKLSNEIVNAISHKLEKQQYTLKNDNWEHWDDYLLLDEVLNGEELHIQVDWQNINRTIVEITITPYDCHDYYKWCDMGDEDKEIRNNLDINIKRKIHEKYPDIIAMLMIWSGTELILGLKIK